MPLTLLTALSLFFAAQIWLHAEHEVRGWTDKNGRQIMAKLIRFNSESIVVEMDWTEYEIPLSNLSAEDQAYVRNLIREREASSRELARRELEREAHQRRLDASLLNNSDFSSSVGWSGSGGRIKLEDAGGVEEDVWRVRLHRNRTEVFGQDFRVSSDVRSIRVTIRYKVSEDFKTYRPSPGAITFFVRPQPRGTYTFFDRQINESSTSWQELSITYGHMDRSNRFRFEVGMSPGEGEIYFKDIFIEPS